MTDHHASPDREHAAERYLLGQMDDATREQYEEHVFGCPECADDLKTTATFLDDVRVQVSPKGGTRSERSADVVTLDSRRPRTLRAFFWPLPSGAAIAATLLVGVIGYQASDVAGLKRALNEEQQLQSVATYFVPVTRGQGTTIAVSSSERKVNLTFSPSFQRPYPFFRCEILDAAGQRVMSRVMKAPPPGTEWPVQIPVSRLASGSYTIVLAVLESEASTTSPLEPIQYSVTLQRQP